MKGKTPQTIILFITLITIAAVSRLLPHWHNFTAVGAAGLFGMYYFRRWWAAVVVVVAGMWISDLILNNVIYAAFNDGFTLFNQYMIWTYLGFAFLAIGGGYFLKNGKPKFLLASLIGSLVFFLFSNLGSFFIDPLYPKTLTGLVTCYIAALPFALNTLLATIFYSYVLYGIYRWSLSMGWHKSPA